MLLICVACCAFFSLRGRAHAQVVISEVHWAGSDLSTADEWLELVNATNESVDVSGWKITVRKNGEDAVMIELPEDTFIEAGAYFLVSNYAADESRLARDPDLVTTAVSLPNTQLSLTLLTASGVTVDRVDDGSGAPFAGENATGTGTRASMERIDLLGLGTDPKNWRTATLSAGFDPGAPMRGTPGTANGNAPAGDDDDDDDPVQCESGVRIGEVLADPSGKDDQEWIELTNAGTETVLMQGWGVRVGKIAYAIDTPVLLRPGAYMSLRKTQTALTLPNNGATVELLCSGTVIDALSYPLTGEEVSYGRDPDAPDTLTAFCIPSEASPNTSRLPDAHILLQSGYTQGEVPHTINVDTELRGGSLSDAQCRWDYGDGGGSDKCNPPAYTYELPDEFTLRLDVLTLCGRLEERTMRMVVKGEASQEGLEGLPGGVSAESGQEGQGGSGALLGVATERAESGAECEPWAGTGVSITEVFPSPSEDEEWIELFNAGEHDAHLCGWILDDLREGGSKPRVLGEDIIVPARNFAILTREQTRIALNNSGDEVWLLDPEGNTRSFVAFPKVKSDWSYAYDADTKQWCLTSNPTPLAAQSCPSVVSATSSSSQAAVASEARSKSTKGTSSKGFLPVRYRSVIAAEDPNDSAMEATSGFVQELAMQTVSAPATSLQNVSAESISIVELGILLGGFLSAGTFGIVGVRRNRVRRRISTTVPRAELPLPAGGDVRRGGQSQ